MNKILLLIISVCFCSSSLAVSIKFINGSNHHMLIKYILCTDVGAALSSQKTCLPANATLYNAKVGQNYIELEIADPYKTTLQLTEAREVDDNGNIIAKIDYQNQFVQKINVLVFDDLGTSKFIFTKGFRPNTNNYYEVGKPRVSQTGIQQSEPFIE